MTEAEDIKRIKGAVDALIGQEKEGRIKKSIDGLLDTAEDGSTAEDCSSWREEEKFHISYKVKGLVGFRGVGGMDVAASTTFGELAAELDAVVGEGQWCDVRVRRV